MVEKTNHSYLLTSCNIGKLDEVIEHLERLHDIKEFQGTYDAYDIVAKVESHTKKYLQQFMTEQIRTIIGIKNALILECKTTGDKHEF